MFVGCDLLALVLQAIGGALAATAKDKRGSDQGVRVMIAGLVSQVVTMALFLALWGDFVVSLRRARRGGLKGGMPGMYEALRESRAFRWFQWGKYFRHPMFILADLARLVRRYGAHLRAVRLQGG